MPDVFETVSLIKLVEMSLSILLLVYQRFIEIKITVLLFPILLRLFWISVSLEGKEIFN